MEILSITETHVLGTDGITYFKVITTTYDDESQDVVKRPVGPASEVAKDSADGIRKITTDLAYYANPASKTKQALTEINTLDADVITLTGVSPLKLILDRQQDNFLAPGWTIDEGAGPIPLVFTINAQGQLRYSVNGAATKNAKTYGHVLRLNNYPASPTDTDFYYNESGGKLFSLPNRNVVIKKP